MSVLNRDSGASSVVPSAPQWRHAAAVGDGDRARSRLRGETLTAPGPLDREVAAVLRRQVGLGCDGCPPRRVGAGRPRGAALQHVPHRSLIDRCWQPRDNVNIYDAAYVALTDSIGADLPTADGRLAPFRG